MKINKIKINSYGKIKNKEIYLNNNLNIIYGKNESGKSTILNFIFNMLYGISKTKNTKEISNYEKYKPWNTEEFSGKLTYELDNKSKYEIFREFNKKNPKIFNQNGEEISGEFNINKKNGNEFFYEQTKIDIDMCLATSISLQQEVKIGKNIQSTLIQKISNLLGTGQDSVSYKKTVENLNKIQLEKIGTERSKEKPINIARKKLEENNNKIKELQNNKNLLHEIEEKINKINDEIIKKENKNNLMKEIKNIFDKKEINNEKIKIKEKIINENNNKKIIIEEKINNKKENFNEIKNSNKKIQNKKHEKNKKIKKYNLIFLILILINILWYIFIPYFTYNKIIKYILVISFPIYLIYYFIKIKNINNKIKNLESNIKNDTKDEESKIEELRNSLGILNENTKSINEEIEKEKNKDLFLFNLEKDKIIKKYSNKINIEEINNMFFDNNLENKLKLLENEIYNLRYELNKLELKKENIEKELEKLSNLEEEQEIIKQQVEELEEENEAIELTKTLLERAYEKMKNNISPRFIENLSKNVASITNGKYKNILFNDEQGLVVEVENGNYVSAERLSVGTIEQLYLSLRLAMLNEISEEKVPIILDETFAYFDDERLENILLFLAKEYKDRQIIIFTCTDREIEILRKNYEAFNLIEL